MRFDDLWVAGLGSWLPPAVSVAEALAAGRYGHEDQTRNEYVSVTMAAAQDAPPVMAARAGREALERAGLPPADVAVLVHASLWYQGVDFWPPAAYIHREVLGGATRAPALDVGQMSNGGLAAVEVGAAFLAADPGRRAALITTADRLAPPGFDRWRSDLAGIVYGDGAAAMVLARRGFARLVSLVTLTDSRLEGMYRGDQPFGPVAGHAGYPLDNRARRAAFLERADRDALGAAITAGLVDTVTAALDDAGLSTGDVDRAVFPSLGLGALRTAYLKPLGLDLERTTWELGQTTGHVGGADQLLGLEWLRRSGRAGPGDRVLLVGIGAGFSWTGAVIEFTDEMAPGAREGT